MKEDDSLEEDTLAYDPTSIRLDEREEMLLRNMQGKATVVDLGWFPEQNEDLQPEDEEPEIPDRVTLGCQAAACGCMSEIENMNDEAGYEKMLWNQEMTDHTFMLVPTEIHMIQSPTGRYPRFWGYICQYYPEAWTSIMCWKCRSKGKRPKQNYFECPSCGHKTNADRNGAINIAGRLITLTKSLHSVRGLGKWASAVNAARSARLKARRKKSRGKSLLSEKGPTSGSGESAAVHYAQASLLSSGDKVRKSDNDPAVESAMETLSVVGSDVPTSSQEKEARSSGGIPSQ